MLLLCKFVSRLSLCGLLWKELAIYYFWKIERQCAIKRCDLMKSEIHAAHHDKKKKNESMLLGKKMEQG